MITDCNVSFYPLTAQRMNERDTFHHTAAYTARDTGGKNAS